MIAMNWHPKPISAATARAVRIQLGMTPDQMAACLNTIPDEVYKLERSHFIFTHETRDFYHKLIELTPHLLARRAKPDWTL
jgi:hypothetical protein